MPDLSKLSNKELRYYHDLFKKGMEKSSRFQDRKLHNTDTKFLYHVVRLLLEAEMILQEGDLDLQRHGEQLKAIRRGEWTEEFLRQWAADKEKSLEDVYLKSQLPHSPDEEVIKTLLRQCLEMHYGCLDKVLPQVNKDSMIVQKIRDLIGI